MAALSGGSGASAAGVGGGHDRLRQAGEGEEAAGERGAAEEAKGAGAAAALGPGVEEGVGGAAVEVADATEVDPEDRLVQPGGRGQRLAEPGDGGGINLAPNDDDRLAAAALEGRLEGRRGDG
jgi:hypothetical protein